MQSKRAAATSHSVMEVTEKTDANTLDCELGNTVNRVCLY
jgi:hypothetical protein